MADVRIRPYQGFSDLQQLRALEFPERRLQMYCQLGPLWRTLSVCRILSCHLYVMTPASSNEIVGTIVMRERLGLPSRDWRIHGVYVAPDFRGKGLGAELITHVLREARRGAARTVSLKVESDNEHAVALYERYGFTLEHQSNRVSTYRIGSDV